MTTVDLDRLIDAAPASRILVRVFLLCAAVVLLDGIDSQVIAIAAPAITRDLGIDRAQLGPIFSAGTLGGAAGGLLCGWLADRWGRQRTLVATTILFGAATLATAWATGLVPLLLLRIATGLGLGGAVPCFIALTSEYTPARRRAGVASLLWSAFPLGATIGGFANAALLRHVDWRMLFYVWGLAPLLVAALLAWGLPESPRYLMANRAGTRRLDALVARIAGRALPPGTTLAASELRPPGAPVRNLFTGGRAPRTVALWVVLFIVLGSLTVLQIWTPALLVPLGVPVSDTALILAFNGFGSFVGTGLAGSLIERFGVARAMIPTMVASAAAVVAFGWAGSFTTLGVAALVAGALLGAASSGAIALSALIYPTSIRSTGIGWAMSSGRLGSVVGPLAIGVMVQAGAAVATIFAAVAAAVLCAAPIIWLLASGRRPAIHPGVETELPARPSS